MELEKLLSNQIKMDRSDRFKTSNQLTLGEIKIKLQNVKNKDLIVVYDFDDMKPTHFMSWRGSYDEIALGFELEVKELLSVKQLLVLCESAIGAMFTGYKGGEFVMGKNTPVWVANYGESGDELGIIDVIETNDKAILKTGYCEY